MLLCIVFMGFGEYRRAVIGKVRDSRTRDMVSMKECKTIPFVVSTP